MVPARASTALTVDQGRVRREKLLLGSQGLRKRLMAIGHLSNSGTSSTSINSDSGARFNLQTSKDTRVLSHASMVPMFSWFLLASVGTDKRDCCNMESQIPGWSADTRVQNCHAKVTCHTILAAELHESSSHAHARERKRLTLRNHPSLTFIWVGNSQFDNAYPMLGRYKNLSCFRAMGLAGVCRLYWRLACQKRERGEHAPARCVWACHPDALYSALNLCWSGSTIRVTSPGP